MIDTNAYYVDRERSKERFHDDSLKRLDLATRKEKLAKQIDAWERRNSCRTVTDWELRVYDRMLGLMDKLAEELYAMDEADV